MPKILILINFLANISSCVSFVCALWPKNLLQLSLFLVSFNSNLLKIDSKKSLNVVVCGAGPSDKSPFDVLQSRIVFKNFAMSL